MSSLPTTCIRYHILLQATFGWQTKPFQHCIRLHVNSIQSQPDGEAFCTEWWTMDGAACAAGLRLQQVANVSYFPGSIPYQGFCPDPEVGAEEAATASVYSSEVSDGDLPWAGSLAASLAFRCCQPRRGMWVCAAWRLLG